MEIKVTNFALTDHFVQGTLKLDFIFPALQEFKKLKVPVNVAYNIIKSISAVEKALIDFDETRKAICESLCDKDEKGKPISENEKYKFTESNLIEFNTKFNELLNTEVVIDIRQINQKDISHIEEVNITCLETLMKFGFVKDEEDLKVVHLNGKADKKELLEAN